MPTTSTVGGMVKTLTALQSPERDFGSDNRSGIAPDALAALLSANGVLRSASYGEDEFTNAATEAISSLFDREVFVTFTPTGTAANISALGALLDGPGSAVVGAHDAHLRVDEAGAIERVWGVPIIPVTTTAGKIDPEALRGVLDQLAANTPFSPTPSVLSVTNLSETGRVYTYDDLERLTALSRSHGLRVHIDGARFANALAAEPRLSKIFEIGVTTLALGGAKNGQGPVEAVVTCDKMVHIKVQRAAKQIGATASKMRFLTAGLAASISSGEFARNASSANTAATRLAAKLTDAGLVPELPTDGNLVFVRLNPELVEPLDHWCHVSHWDGKGLVRLACSFDHTAEDVDRLVAGIAYLNR